jgi:8-amino-7-oxononanoate synthase
VTARPHPLRHLEVELAALAAKRLRRERRPPPGAGALVLSSNDYLGYASRGALASAGGDARTGAGASRLVSGTHPEHLALEREVAEWVAHEDALVFTSGYAANVGLVSALAGPEDVIVSDELNHASIIDGCRLSRARVLVAPHLDVAGFERSLASAGPSRRRWVVTEGYFSMDGDVPDLAGLRAVADRHDAALLVDEAHALGVLGPGGAGACAAAGVRADAVVGTFGKAVGGQGAFVAGSRALTDWLWNRARSLVFSTGLSPLMAAIDLEGVRRARSDDPARARLASLSARLREALRAFGYEVPTGTGPILPVVLGGEERALAASAALLARGIDVTAIRPPTVPAGASRLRVTVHAGLSDAELDRAIAAFRGAAEDLGLRAPTR